MTKWKRNKVTGHRLYNAEYDRAWYQKNKERIREKHRAWSKKNKEKINQKARNFTKLHPEKRKEIRDKWMEKFLDENGIKYNNKYYIENKDRLDQYKRTPVNRKRDNIRRRERQNRKIAIRKYYFNSVATLCIDAIESDGKRIPITKEGLEFLKKVIGIEEAWKIWRPSKEEQKAYNERRDKKCVKKHGLRYHAKRYRDIQKKLNPNYKRYARKMEILN